MSGYKRWNFPAFDQAAAFLRTHGWVVHSPAEHDREQGIDEFAEVLPEWWSLSHAMKWDLARVAEDDAVVFLAGWEDSNGSNKEARVGLDSGSDFYLYLVENSRELLIPMASDYVAKVVARNCRCQEVA